MNELLVKSKIRDYKVAFENSVSKVFLAIEAMPNKVLVIDENVLEIYRQEIEYMAETVDIIPFKAIEDNKDLDAVTEIYKSLIDRNAKRNINLVSVGGGITQDVTGFVASTLYRGVNWTYVPTTFLAQTDSCIGSKTSLNFQNRKNLLGTFYPPSLIYLCSAFLSTLTEIDFYSGIGETIKFQLMNPFVIPDLCDIGEKIERLKKFESLDEVIRENMAVKINYMENDEFDLGRRNLLNYGHCFGHALEISSEYAIPHGIAVSVGILFAGVVSVNRDKMNRAVFKGISEIILPCLPVRYDERHYDQEVLLSAMKNDKKRIGSKLSIVLSNNDFVLTKCDDFEEREFYEALKTLIEILERN
jgi:3-dehydroquinate synthase